MNKTTIKKENTEVKNTVKKEPKQTKPKNLVSAVLQVMNEVKGIEKNLTVGSGNYSYKGVSDSDVKRIIGDAMVKAGLIILPVNIEPKMKIERWKETTNYGEKQKQQIFVELKTKYKLIHESGESEIIEGYGHGIDNMDKASGKASTYALKYTLLYTFLVPTGEIHDTDKEHSETIDIPKKESLTDERFTKACNVIDKGEYSIERLKEDYDLTENQLKELEEWKQHKI